LLNLGGAKVLESDKNFKYFDDIKALSDANKKHLGMIPYSALEDSYLRGEVLILINSDRVIGYLLFRIGPTHRRISITHLCIDNSCRKMGDPELLLNYLKSLTVTMNYKDILLNCRRDYIAASKVWESNLFRPVAEQPGRGNSSEKTLVSWWWVNDRLKDLIAAFNSESEKICAVLDVNVLVDLSEEDSGLAYLLDDALADEVEFYVAPESSIETNRHEGAEVRKKMRTFIGKFLSVDINDGSIEELIVGLRKLLPFKTTQEKSDIRQLAQSISGKKSCLYLQIMGC
jgi:ribosomal protein S18 acetylase RimI-like enzyme